MKVQGNSVIFTDKENAKIKEIKNKHNDLYQYKDEIFDYLKTLGLEFDIKSIPSNPGVYMKCDTPYKGWKGTLDIQCTSHENICVSNVLWNGWGNEGNEGNESIFEVETCTGGGGNHCQFNREFIILFSTLPKLKYKMFKEGATEEINNRFIKALQVEIKEEQNKFRAKVQDNIKNDNVCQDLTDKIKNIEMVLAESKKEKSKRVNYINKSTINQTPIELTDISEYSNTILNMNEYNKVDDYIFVNKDSEVKEIAREAFLFIEEHPEYFI